ncbi:nucleotidyltransferase family protein [Natrinema sp. 1APR25-10V2]|uniref:nucleotidyltransferase family protein n=1 Tax=Natrinema sp. 1APR25-10V2 TaxID=2951081 RepID=UPI0028756207|nr:nucleotidyltransferase family protein [Natrinema sp. 1APR25-10V2]MDS0477273.1 nucleotidyltransferase family protein [Natrinema sp. 1APR25-10V2]
MADQSDVDRITDGSDGGSARDAIGGVILAAGKGTRFEGGNKLLADVDGTPIVRRAAETLCRSSVDDIVAVVGHEADRVTAALADLEFSIRYNENYAAGQSATVRVGVDAARDAGWDATVFMLGDMPFVRPQTVDTLRTVYARGGGSIVAPTYEGQRGNPVLFGRQHYDALSTVSGDRGGRDLIENHEDTAFVDVDDPGVTRDIDSKADLEQPTE